jgi:hypothetical protein
VSTAVTVDAAGGPMGGAARFRDELLAYLNRSGRADVKVIGARRRLSPGWLIGREAAAAQRGRRVALNNVGFLTPGGERWTLLGNALHFLTTPEVATLDPALRSAAARQAIVVRRAARRSDVLIAPSTSMAERVAAVAPEVASRLVVRMHPLSPCARPAQHAGQGLLILCPVIFAAYKHMPERLAEWLAAVPGRADPPIRMLVTASPDEVPADLAGDPRLEFTGRLPHAALARFWARSTAIFFPSGLESFGYPLAEARVYGLPVIAQDTAQNQEVGGPALCGFTAGDPDSLRAAIEVALGKDVQPDPAPFDPDAYFDWMLGAPR